MIAERGRKGDLFPRRLARGGQIRRTKLPDQLRGEQFNDIGMVLLGCVDDLNQGGATERTNSQKPGTKRRPDFAPQRRNVSVEKGECARYRPFARDRSSVKDKRVGGVELNGAQQLHGRGPRLPARSPSCR